MPYLVIHLWYVYILASPCLPYIISRESKVTQTILEQTEASVSLFGHEHMICTHTTSCFLPGNSSIKGNKRNKIETMSSFFLYHKGHIAVLVDYQYLVWFKHIALQAMIKDGAEWKAMFSPHLYDLQYILPDLKIVSRPPTYCKR